MATKTIRTRNRLAGPDGNFPPGTVLTMDASKADQLISEGFADEVGIGAEPSPNDSSAAASAEVKEEVIETAEGDPPEEIAAKVPKRKGRGK